MTPPPREYLASLGRELQRVDAALALLRDYIGRERYADPEEFLRSVAAPNLEAVITTVGHASDHLHRAAHDLGLSSADTKPLPVYVPPSS